MRELLDLRTILLFYSILTLAIGLLMVHFASTQKTYAGFKHWTVAAFLASAGFFLLGLRGLAPLFLTIILANIASMASWLLVKKGLEAFFRQKSRHYLDLTLFIIFCALFTYFATVTPDLTVRMVLCSIYVGYLTLNSAYITHIGTRQFLDFPQPLLPAWLLIIGLLSLLLAVIALLGNYSPRGSLMGVSFPYKLVGIVMSASVMVVYFGLISLCYSRMTYELLIAQKKVKILRGILSICMHCKKIHLEGNPKEDSASWMQLEKYIDDHSEAMFSHGICPDCMKEHYIQYMK